MVLWWAYCGGCCYYCGCLADCQAQERLVELTAAVLPILMLLEIVRYTIAVSGAIACLMELGNSGSAGRGLSRIFWNGLVLTSEDVPEMRLR